MNIDKQSVVELTRALDMLSGSINRMVIIMAICMFISMAFMWFIIKYYEKLSNYSLGSFNQDKASKLYETNRLQDLLKYCLKFHSKYPNDVQITFYLGLAYYKLGNFSLARQHFESAAELNPHYKESVQPYLEEISMQIKSIKDTNIN